MIDLSDFVIIIILFLFPGASETIPSAFVYKLPISYERFRIVFHSFYTKVLCTYFISLPHPVPFRFGGNNRKKHSKAITKSMTWFTGSSAISNRRLEREEFEGESRRKSQIFWWDKMILTRKYAEWRGETLFSVNNLERNPELREKSHLWNTWCRCWEDDPMPQFIIWGVKNWIEVSGYIFTDSFLLFLCLVWWSFNCNFSRKRFLMYVGTYLVFH